MAPAIFIIEQTLYHVTHMLLHTQPSSKRAFKGHLRPKKHSATTHRPPIQESGDLDVIGLYEVEREKNMRAARYIAICEVIMVVLMLCGLLAKHQLHGYVQRAFLEFVFITCTSLIICAAYLWHLTQDFFSELKRNRAARK